MVERLHDRSSARWQFGKEAVGVGLIDDLTVQHSHSVFVFLAGADIGDEQLPNTRWHLFLHAMRPTVPMIEIADELDALSIGSPNSKVDSGLTVDITKMRAEAFVDLPVLASTEQMAVKVTDQ